MPDVNLLISDTRTPVVSEKTQKLVRKLSTVVLVGYLVVVIGYMGWIFYSSTKTKSVSNELTMLNQQVTARATEEVIVRRLDERARYVMNFLEERPRAGKSIELMSSQSPVVIGWKLSGATGLQTVKVQGTSSADIWNYVSYLGQYFTNIRVDSVAFTSKDGWTGTVTVGGIKNEI